MVAPLSRDLSKMNAAFFLLVFCGQSFGNFLIRLNSTSLMPFLITIFFFEISYTFPILLSFSSSESTQLTFDTS